MNKTQSYRHCTDQGCLVTETVVPNNLGTYALQITLEVPLSILDENRGKNFPFYKSKIPSERSGEYVDRKRLHGPVY